MFEILWFVVAMLAHFSLENEINSAWKYFYLSQSIFNPMKFTWFRIEKFRSSILFLLPSNESCSSWRRHFVDWPTSNHFWWVMIFLCFRRAVSRTIENVRERILCLFLLSNEINFVDFLLSQIEEMKLKKKRENKRPFAVIANRIGVPSWNIYFWRHSAKTLLQMRNFNAHRCDTIFYDAREAIFHSYSY